MLHKSGERSWELPQCGNGFLPGGYKFMQGQQTTLVSAKSDYVTDHETMPGEELAHQAIPPGDSPE
jgi:hypothetical protein